MAYNDVAGHHLNPFYGQMFHTKSHDPDVYPGSDKINIKGDNVDGESFCYSIKKNIQSTTVDDLLIYFDDHGGQGFLSFPLAHLYGDDFANAVSEMENNGKYKRCLFCIEACYAGSVAELLTANCC